MPQDTLVEEVFSDTCILLDFVQQNDREPHSIALVESDAVDIIVSDAVMEELANVTDRRQDIYADLLDYLSEAETGLVEYDPADRHVYVGSNDRDYIQNLQMDLRDIDDNREVLRRLRRFLRAIEQRRQYLEQEFEDCVVMPRAPLPLEWAIQDVTGNADDARVVTDAAGWTAEGGSGVLVTRDVGDILEYEAELVDLLREQQGPEWVLQIQRPKTFLMEFSAEAD